VLIASTNARFADTHARIGIMPGWGLLQKLPRMIGISRAKELAFTGNFLDAATALQGRLVNHVVAPEALLPLARRLAGDMAGIDPAFLHRYRRLIDDGYAMSLGEGLALEAARSRTAKAAVSPQDVAARRAAVRQRGREQGKGQNRRVCRPGTPRGAASAPLAEERAEQLCCFFGTDPGIDLGAVEALRLCEHTRAVLDRTAFGIACGVVEPGDAGMPDRAGAHRARLEGHPQLAIAEPLNPQHPCRAADR
jgi:hypothetical protein